MNAAKTPKGSKTACTVSAFCDAMEVIAPTRLAQSWDNVGLIAGDRTAPVRRALLCIDLTPAVAEEAIRRKADLVFAYHPPIFKPIARLVSPSAGTDATVLNCIRHGIAIYASHTALDAADGGTNDVIASLCGITETEPIEYADGAEAYKLVVFVPPGEVDAVADAMFAVGAGRIGDYTQCSFRLDGQGTFFGGDATQPAVGQRGQLEHAEEVRLETVVPGGALPAVVQAIRSAHSYEEPAFDVYPTRAELVRGIGRVGRLPRPITLKGLARKLKRAVSAACAQVVGDEERTVDRAIILVGAAGTLPFRVPPKPTDVIITGEIRHHDALSILRRDCSAIALGHWASERPMLTSLAERLAVALKGVTVEISGNDRDPFASV